MLFCSLGTCLPSFANAEVRWSAAYVAYAGPYASSPASAFGHVFLVLSPHGPTPLPLWDVLGFVAETKGAGPFRFVAKGVGGGFSGAYKKSKFHEQTRHYGALEDRDIWAVRLQLDPSEIGNLGRAISRTQGQDYPYLFFTRNCASYLQDLLASVTPLLPESSGIVSPVSVFEAITESGIANGYFYLPSASTRLTGLAATLSPIVNDRIETRNWISVAKDTNWVLEQSPSDLAFMREYFPWRALHYDLLLPRKVQETLRRLRVNGALNARRFREDSSPARVLAIDRKPAFHHYQKMSLAAVATGHSEIQIRGRYRPALHEWHDSSVGYRPVNTMEALVVGLSWSSRRPGLQLDELTLLSQKALIPRRWGEASLSWSLDISGHRGGVLGPEVMQWGIRVGRGATKEVGSGLYGYALATGSILATAEHGGMFVPGSICGLIWLPPREWRARVEMDLQQVLGDWPSPSLHLDGRLWRDLGSRFGIQVRGRLASEHALAEVSVSHYL